MSAALETLSVHAGVRSIFVYISEAHAEDEWPVATPVEYAVDRNHCSIADRQSCAARAKAALQGLAALPVFLDTMEDGFLRMYGAWPTQLYFFDKGALAHKATPADAAFDVVDFYSKVREILAAG